MYETACKQDLPSIRTRTLLLIIGLLVSLSVLIITMPLPQGAFMACGSRQFVDDTDSSPGLAGFVPHFDHTTRRPHQIYVQQVQQQREQEKPKQQKVVVDEPVRNAAQEVAEILILDPEYELR